MKMQNTQYEYIYTENSNVWYNSSSGGVDIMNTNKLQLIFF